MKKVPPLFEMITVKPPFAIFMLELRAEIEIALIEITSDVFLYKWQI